MVRKDFDLVPRKCADVTLHPLGEDSLLVLADHRRSILKGRDVVLVSEAIDGARTIYELVTSLQDELHEFEILNALRYLYDKSCIAMGEVDQQSPAEAFLAYLARMTRQTGGAHAAAVEAVSPTVRIINRASSDCCDVSQALSANGIKTSDAASLALVLIDQWASADMQQLRQDIRMLSCRVLVVALAGATPLIGPLFDQTEGPCPVCAEHWLLANRPVERWMIRIGVPRSSIRSAAKIDVARFALLGQLPAVILNLLRGEGLRERLRQHVCELDTADLSLRYHRVLRRPQCPCCGQSNFMSIQARQPIRICASTALAAAEGGTRTVSPESTFETYKHLISPISGPICYLHTMPGRHGETRKVYVAGYMVCPIETPQSNAFDKICAGKGKSDAQARASALCEAIERYSGVYQGDESCIMDSFNGLGGASNAIGYDVLQGFSERQFACRDQINALTKDPRRQVPQRFDPDAVIAWTSGYSMVHERFCYVPLSYCYAHGPVDHGLRFGIHNPNGSASGNCIEEAILQGFFELVERDAVAIWWYNRLQMPALEVGSFDDPYYHMLVQHYASLGWQIDVIDISTDLEIPVFAAIARHQHLNRHAIGFGAHIDATIALQRAMTELNQLFDPSREDLQPWDSSALPDTGFLVPSAGRTPRMKASYPTVPQWNLRWTIEHILEKVRRRGMDLIVVNKTRPDLAMPVVQVIVPGLRHFWPRFGPGRLYEVPVAMGLRAEAQSESNLNPVPLFL